MKLHMHVAVVVSGTIIHKRICQICHRIRRFAFSFRFILTCKYAQNTRQKPIECKYSHRIAFAVTVLLCHTICESVNSLIDCFWFAYRNGKHTQRDVLAKNKWLNIV